VRIDSVTLRWQAVALAAVILLALVVWVTGLRRRFGAAVRGEDVAIVLLATIPGAVVGGRVVHGISFADVYARDPVTLLDPGRGSLSLVGAVLGGALAAGSVCRLLGYRVGPWADAAGVPLLLAIGLGKLAMVLGGAGSGGPFDSPVALSFAGPGPWASIDPTTPAHASQVYEGLWALVGTVPVWWLGRSTAWGCSGRGLVLLVAITWWLAGRAMIALTWRDDVLVGPLGAEGVATLMVLGAGVALFALVTSRQARPGTDPSTRGRQPPI
jgi:prolipoprotein diacylglyceryltransferase